MGDGQCHPSPQDVRGGCEKCHWRLTVPFQGSIAVQRAVLSFVTLADVYVQLLRVPHGSNSICK